MLRPAPLAIVALALAACDAGFYEPNPPVLRSVSKEFVHPVVNEPAVFGLAIDLHIPDPVECRAAHQWLMQSVEAFLPAQVPTLRLSVQDLSPGCQQPSDRRLDVALWMGELEGASSEWGAERVRPVFLYANNVDLPLPPGLAQDLQTLPSLGLADRPPVTVGIAAAAPLELGFDHSIAWTFATDPRLGSAIRAVADGLVPFRTRHPLPPQPLFTEDELRGIHSFRWCAGGQDLTATGFELGRTVRVSPELGAAVASNVPLGWLEPKTAMASVTLSLGLDVCSDHCDRYVHLGSSGFRRWADLRTCVADDPPENVSAATLEGVR